MGAWSCLKLLPRRLGAAARSEMASHEANTHGAITRPASPPSLMPKHRHGRWNSHIDRSSLFVSPLRNATGIATKNFAALGAGVPLLTSAIGTAGAPSPRRARRPSCITSRSMPIRAAHVRAVIQSTQL